MPAVLVCGLAVGALLIAEWHDSRLGIWVAKPVAAGSYIAAALAWGALNSLYGWWLLAGLICCWCGDLLLIPRQRRTAFRAGIVAFLIGHVAYVVAFLQHRIDASGLLLGTGLAVVLALSVARWLGPKLTFGTRNLVRAYTGVISAMLIVAFGATAGSGPLGIAAGAALFALSDLTVARDRFASRAFINRLLGLPLYFCAQLILAYSVVRPPV